jgi:hypothetical protein
VAGSLARKDKKDTLGMECIHQKKTGNIEKHANEDVYDDNKEKILKARSRNRSNLNQINYGNKYSKNIKYKDIKSQTSYHHSKYLRQEDPRRSERTSMAARHFLSSTHQQIVEIKSGFIKSRRTD